MADLSRLNCTVLFAFAVIPSRTRTHIASVLKPAMGVACPLMCMYKSHTKKCGGNVPMIVLPSLADVGQHRKPSLARPRAAQKSASNSGAFSSPAARAT
jgi:hypothetical protein